ncbi:MAG: glucosamine-6-phosphate deaminase [Pirellulales bacterium]|nr:glucosamine-6-phosphate deaminase [Pirellulales bacterium]
MLKANEEMMGQREKIPTHIYDEPKRASKAVADEIAHLIRQRAGENKMCVLGLATGSTPVSVYDELVRMHREEDLSFANVITFNLDEYYPMQRDALQSYHRFMSEHLFDHVDIEPDNVHIPDGTLAIEEVHRYCKMYEQDIEDAGGLDLQLLGIGRTGHIGFNEPGSGRNSRTRLITLDTVTRLDAASDFFGEENVPMRAITMGVGTILAAKRVIIMAFGENKAPIVAKAVEGPITDVVAASFLQEHDNSEFVMDQAAAAELTRCKCPWLVGPTPWDTKLIRRAVIWLAQREGKAILKLTASDYNENGLQDLLAEHGPVHELNVSVFRQMQDTINGWPGGKPAEKKLPGDRRRAHDDIFPKRVLIFSPHPDDDVISMGGTLIRLVDHGHEVHVAYQTSGNIAVFDTDALRFADFVREFNAVAGIDPEKTNETIDGIEKFLLGKTAAQVDIDSVQDIKGLIRRTETRAAGRQCGVDVANLHFLDLPFYETGTVRKKPPGEDDIRITVELLDKIQPHQIYAAGDLSDPHGTHRTCLSVIFKAMDECADRDWHKTCQTWLYRGAWQEWMPEEIEMAVPLSPMEVARKRAAVFHHESQKDRALFPGTDEREFWQRAEDRNRATAEMYDNLGLAEYEAMEAFVEWKGEGI